MIKYLCKLEVGVNVMKYVYACITYKCHRDIDEVKKTKKYKKAVDIAKAMGIENIIVDICTSRNRRKINLETILSTPENVIVVSDITSLGQKDELFDVYKRIRNSGNDILICYFGKGGMLESDELSSVSMLFAPKMALTLDEVKKAIDDMTASDFLSDSRKSLDPRIVDGYWQIEKGEKTQMEVVKELETSKSTFIRRTEEYVGSDEWFSRYLSEIEDPTFVNTPTRLGDISDDAKKWYEFLLMDDHKDDVETYGIYVAASFADVAPELWNQLCELNNAVDLDAIGRAECKRLEKRYTVIAHHTYRQMLRYRKYIKRLRYRQ